MPRKDHSCRKDTAAFLGAGFTVSIVGGVWSEEERSLVSVGPVTV